jgi:hypothetical protein
MKRFALYIILCYCSLSLFSGTGNDPIGKIVNDFLSSDWPTVMHAKEKMENLGSEGIPEIIAIMNDCRVNNLQNTGDLIFPGAEKYYGHGQIIDYDIDDICVRAGWLLEELTFKDFGFTGIHLPYNELSDFIYKSFPDYIDNTVNQRHLAELTESGKRKLIRSLSIERVKEWWKSDSLRWNRLNALEYALNSQDEKCQVKALFYMRNGKTRCSGLDEKYYKSHLEQVVMKLSKESLNRVSENAKLIMLDNDFEWLSIKPVN